MPRILKRKVNLSSKAIVRFTTKNNINSTCFVDLICLNNLNDLKYPRLPFINILKHSITNLTTTTLIIVVKAIVILMETPLEISDNHLDQIHVLTFALGLLIHKNHVISPQILVAVNPAMTDMIENLLHTNISRHAHVMILNHHVVLKHIRHVLVNARQVTLIHLLDNTNYHTVHIPNDALIVIELIGLEVDRFPILIIFQHIPINPPLTQLNNQLSTLIINLLLRLNLNLLCTTQQNLLIRLVLIFLLLQNKTVILKLSPYSFPSATHSSLNFQNLKN